MTPTNSPRPRRPRISEQETVSRMLETGIQLVDQGGLRVSFEPMRLEEIIARADVSRVAVYRHWVTREAYFLDLLVALAKRGEVPSFSAVDESGEVTLPKKELDLSTPESRRAGLVELCRISATQSAQRLAGDEFGVRFALFASLFSLPPGDGKDKLQQAVATSEAAAMTELANSYDALAATFGMRPQQQGMTSEQIAYFGAAFLTGYAFTNRAVPDAWALTYSADPFHTGQEREWSAPAIGFTGLILSLYEPDPDFEAPKKITK